MAWVAMLCVTCVGIQEFVNKLVPVSLLYKKTITIWAPTCLPTLLGKHESIRQNCYNVV